MAVKSGLVLFIHCLVRVGGFVWCFDCFELYFTFLTKQYKEFCWCNATYVQWHSNMEYLLLRQWDITRSSFKISHFISYTSRWGEHIENRKNESTFPLISFLTSVFTCCTTDSHEKGQPDLKVSVAYRDYKSFF